METPIDPSDTECRRNNTHHGLKIIFRIQIDPLNTTNYADWHVSLMDACTITDAEWEIQPS